MTLQLLFWILMLFWAVFGAWSGYTMPATPGQPNVVRYWGGSLLLFLLLLILGWQTFGAPVK
ncbi:MAG: hypothetical protein WBY44_22930 [Bryobacteraceae bacterium]